MGMNQVHSMGTNGNLFDEINIVQRPVVIRSTELVHCPDCGEREELETFAEAVEWNLRHITEHGPQPTDPHAPAPQAHMDERSCHLCAGKSFQRNDGLRRHVNRFHEMGMPEWRALKEA